MDYLDHLEFLDDAAPPRPDAAMLSLVRRRANRRRNRNRLTVVSALVLVVAIAAGITAAARRGTTKFVVVTGVPTTTSVPSATSSPPLPTVFVGGSSAGTLPNGLHVEMTLGAPTLQLGSNIPYKIELRNDTGQAKTIGQGHIDCLLGGFAPALFDAKGKFPADKPPLASDCTRVMTLPAGGVTTFTGWLVAQRVGFETGARHAYFTVTVVKVLDAKTGFRRWREVSELKPIPVEFIAPDLTVHLLVPNQAVIAGSIIKGTVIFDNAGHTEVSAGCASAPNYLIALTVMQAGPVSFVTSEYTFPNPSTPCPGRDIMLEPGTTRLPFAITAKYYGCYPSLPNGQRFTVIAGSYVPTCIGPHVPPPLPPGRYQLVYTGAAGVGAVVVPPIPIEIRSSK